MEQDKKERLDLLLSMAKEGNEPAFEGLVLETEDILSALAAGYALKEEDTKDLLQEIYIKLWRSLSSYRGDCSAATWIYRIANNAARDMLRRERLRRFIPLFRTNEEGEEEPLPLASLDISPEESMLDKERRQAVREGIMKLPQMQKEILILRDVNSLSYKEISEILKIEEGTVKSRLSRARNMLKEHLKKGNFL